MTKCKHCGAGIPEGAAFCEYCDQPSQDQPAAARRMAPAVPGQRTAAPILLLILTAVILFWTIPLPWMGVIAGALLCNQFIRMFTRGNHRTVCVFGCFLAILSILAGFLTIAVQWF